MMEVLTSSHEILWILWMFFAGAIVSTRAIYFYHGKITIKDTIFILIHGLGTLILFVLSQGYISTILEGNISFIIYIFWHSLLPLVFLYFINTDLLKSTYAVALSYFTTILYLLIYNNIMSFLRVEFPQNAISLVQMATTLLLHALFTIPIGKIDMKFSSITNDRRFRIIFSLLVFSIIVGEAIFILISDNLYRAFSALPNLAHGVMYFLAIALIVIIVINLSMRYTRKVKHEAEQKYIKEVEERQLEIRRFRHDYLHLLSTMKSFISDKDFEGLEQYYNSEIMPTTEWLNHQNIELGNLGNLEIKEIKSLLSMKLMQAQTLQIETIIEIPEVVNKINMKSSLLARILGNLLDNAIEELAHIEAPMLNFAILDKEDHQLIVVRNTCRDDVPTTKQLFEKGFSTKGDNRGMGLSTVKQIIGKLNHVSLTTKAENGYFVQELKIEK